MESQRAKAKAIEVVKLLSDLSESDMTPCVATSVELSHYAHEVQGLVDQNTSNNISDRLLWLLRGLTQGHNIIETSVRPTSNTLTDISNWSDDPVRMNAGPTSLCAIVEECSPSCSGCDSPKWRSSSMDEIAEELLRAGIRV
jgi:hypothetical protein